MKGIGLHHPADHHCCRVAKLARVLVRGGIWLSLKDASRYASSHCTGVRVTLELQHGAAQGEKDMHTSLSSLYCLAPRATQETRCQGPLCHAVCRGGPHGRRPAASGAAQPQWEACGRSWGSYRLLTAAVERQIMQGKPRVCLSQEECNFSVQHYNCSFARDYYLQDSTTKPTLAASCPTLKKCIPKRKRCYNKTYL